MIDLRLDREKIEKRDKQITENYKDGVKIKDICKNFHISNMTIYNALRRESKREKVKNLGDK
jgi:Mor family transcriptional regulator